MVLDGAVSGEQLRWKIVLSDATIGTRKRVLLVTKGADPDARLVLHAGVGVQDGAAPTADERVVLQQRKLARLHQGGTHYAEWDD